MAAVTPADRVREYCREAGIHPDNPLLAALLTVVDTAEMAREAAVETRATLAAAEAMVAEAREASANARVLTPEGEASLIKQLVEKSLELITDAIRRGVITMRARTFRESVLATTAGGLLLAGLAYYQGHTTGVASVQHTASDLQVAAFKDGPAGAAAWLRLMRANDPVVALAACAVNPGRGSEPRRACGLPVWLDVLPIKPPQ